MRNSKYDWDALNVSVRIITFDADFMARAYVEQTGLEWPLLIDSEKKLYRGYGMEKGSWWKIAGPVSILKYLKLMFAGNRLQKSGSDYRQLGGDILVDPNGIVQLHHVSDNPHDRPGIESIVSVIHSWSAEASKST